MKKIWFVIILAAILPGLFSCTSRNEKCKIVTVKFDREANDNPAVDVGNSVVDYTGCMYFAYISDKEGLISLPVSEHALMFINDNFEDRETYYEYSPEDGNELEFLLSDSTVILNGQLIAIPYDGSPQAERRLSTLSDDQIKHLKFLYFELDTVYKDLSQIDRVARINPQIGLFSYDPAIFMALEKFSPKFLYVEDENGCRPEVIEKICSKESIERLVLFSCYGNDLNPILKMPHLRKLTVPCFEEYDTNFRLNENTTLEMLVLNSASCKEVKFKNLDFLGDLRGLKQLTVLGAADTLDISGLSKLKSLKSVNILGNIVSGLSSLKDNHILESFCFPSNISQQDFNEFISDHAELNYISLTGCENVTDLSPLLGLKNLGFLILSPLDSGFTAESLKGFSKLDYLSIGPVDEKDSTLIPEIKAVLPNTIINENSGICLGSGYLLLVIPLFLLFSVISMVYRRRFS